MKRMRLNKQPIDASPPKTPYGVPVVGLGASAGGLEALKEFFAAMPADSGMGFVVVQHLEPTHESRMAVISGARATKHEEKPVRK